MQLTEQSNLSELFLTRVQDTPSAPAYRQFDGTRWIDLDWGEVGRAVGRWQAAFEREGITPGERVAICMRNRVEWVLFDQAALGLGLVTVPLYFDDRPDNMAWCVNDAGARILFLESAAQWPAMRAIAASVQRVVCLDQPPVDDPKCVALQQWLPAEGQPPRRSPAAATDLATLV